MKELVRQVQTIKVKTLLFAIFGISLCTWLYTYSVADTYHFEKLSEKSITIQKECLDQFISVFRQHKIPMILFDIDILPELFQARPKSWHKSTHQCKTLCKYHPEDKNVITFAIQGSKFEGKEEKVIKSLESLGFTLHLSMDVDPRLLATEGIHTLIPTYLWVARHDHVIHVAFLHERLGSYVWTGPVRPEDWNETVRVLAPALSDGWHSMERIGAKFPTYAQAFDKSQRFLGLPLEIDGHQVSVPYHIKAFLKEYKESRFVECDHDRARAYKTKHEKELTPAHVEFKTNAKKLILKAKGVLDALDIPFWLSSGTCLGWFRQCDIIPYTEDVDFGILIYDYNLKMIEELHDVGLTLIHKFGKTDDSLELSFMGDENIKLDIFFFYEDYEYTWNGGTRAHDGQKYKYKFPRFELCWTEFLEIKIRVPCEPEKYVAANYGDTWMVPIKDWQWNIHPPNVKPNGKWKKSDRNVAVQIFERNEEHYKAIDGLRKNFNDYKRFPSEMDAILAKLPSQKQLPKEYNEEKVGSNENVETDEKLNFESVDSLTDTLVEQPVDSNFNEDMDSGSEKFTDSEVDNTVDEEIDVYSDTQAVTVEKEDLPKTNTDDESIQKNDEDISAIDDDDDADIDDV